MEEKNTNYMEEDEITVTLTLPDDSTITCSVIAIVEADNGREYIALLPLDAPDNEEAGVYLYRYIETNNGEPSLENIEDESEYEVAAAAFDKILDEE